MIAVPPSEKTAARGRKALRKATLAEAVEAEEAAQARPMQDRLLERLRKSLQSRALAASRRKVKRQKGFQSPKSTMSACQQIHAD
jgi:hypothetical protein